MTKSVGTGAVGLCVILLGTGALTTIHRAQALEGAVGAFEREFVTLHQSHRTAPAEGAVRPPALPVQRVGLRLAGIESVTGAGVASGAGVITSLSLLIMPTATSGALTDAYGRYASEVTARQQRIATAIDPHTADLAAQLVFRELDDLRRASAEGTTRGASALALLVVGLGLGWGVTATRRVTRVVVAPPPADPALAAVGSGPVVSIGADDAIVEASGDQQPLAGPGARALVGAPIASPVVPAEAAALRACLAACRQRPLAAQPLVVRSADSPETWCRLELISNRRRSDERSRTVRLRVTNVTEQRHIEEALNASSEMLRSLTEASPQAITVEDVDGRVKLWNAASGRIFGWTGDEVLLHQNPSLPPDLRHDRENLRRQVLAGHSFAAMETTRRCKDGSIVQVSASIAPLRDSSGEVWGFVEVLTDITERKALEAQLLQAQKMEGIGRMAGGIAHDFNNLLTVILGQTDLLLGMAEDPLVRRAAPALQEDLEQIKLAADRASHLTRQLLAFTRNQVMQPQAMDLNQTITEMHRMVRRLIGEDIELVTVPGEKLDLVQADPTHLTQVLINLAVNARDAMPHGGKLVIETANVELDDLYARKRLAVVPGRYVMLAVSDTGHGMDRDTQARIFEPFFTTKERGKGTGLGLSTAYGIVKQSGGYIWCYSEPGHGTCLKVYLPAVGREKTEALPERRPAPTANAGETVLLVEDEEIVRSLVKQVLTLYGYRVIEAQNGEAALRIAGAYDGRIDILVTDLVMPGMNGIEVAKGLTAVRPETRILFMSGYTDHAVVRHHQLHPKTPFIQKPFAPDRLARKVREVLNGPLPEANELGGNDPSKPATAAAPLTRSTH